MFSWKYLRYLFVLLTIVGIFCLYEIGEMVGSEQISVGLTFMTMNNDFYKTLYAEIEQGSYSQDIRFYMRDAELDEEKQSQQIDFFIQKQVDVIVLNPVKGHSPRMTEALERAKEAGIKTIVVDAPVAKDISVDTTIISDNYQAGVLIAKDMMRRVSGANILILKHQNALSAIDRIRGFTDTIKGKVNYQVVSERETMGQTEESMEQVMDIFQTETAIDVIMALNDKVAIGALAAIEHSGINRNIMIYGVDGSPDIKGFLSENNNIQGSVAQSPIQMGQQVTEVINTMLSADCSYSLEYSIPVQLITRDNIHERVITGWQ